MWEALKLMRKLTKQYGFLPNMLVKGDLLSAKAAGGQLGIANDIRSISDGQPNGEDGRSAVGTPTS